ncbi:MAG: 4a-hydroxytetrahydrobiopterin dehydratase [Patescibacteria group bacterium]|jgi:4a-hydroxytetrahydrobiopterin dehydratase
MENQLDLRPLNQQEIEDRLSSFSGWNFGDDKITKSFQFPSFDEAVNFVAGLASFCNGIDHHPDIHIYYKKVVFDLQRFSVGGKVTDRDFTVAKEIERLYALKNY